ncbi:MAG: ABC transporter ATP-binding protein [Chloroflexi bacterium]|nr:ABC transporter ATP-binding protein [Chloroflexota bacterium]
MTATGDRLPHSVAPHESDLAVRCAGLSKRFGYTLAVASVDLEVKSGSFVVLLGPSGCGKSTVLRLIAGFEVPDAGMVTIGGRLVVGVKSFVPPDRRWVGMVFQDGALFPHLTVAGNIAYGIRTSAERSSRVDELLDTVGLRGMGNRMPHELSGGEQQRVALARALAPRPTVVLLDEPFSSLDAGLRSRLRTEVRAILRQAGATAIFVTHDQDEALSLADEVAVMWQGRIVQRSTPQELYGSPASYEVAAFVGDANFLSGRADDGSVETELGILAATGAVTGTVHVLVRPEAVRVALDETSEIAVTDIEFFGHDRMYGVALPSGTRLKSRVAGESSIRPGDRVRLEITGPVITFPRASQ